MYDSREKAIRDRQWELNASRKEGLIEGKIEGLIEGRIEGEIKTIRVLQEILQIPLSTDSDFERKSLHDLQSLTSGLQERVRLRHTS